MRTRAQTLWLCTSIFLIFSPARAELLKEVRVIMGTRLEITVCGGEEKRDVLDGAFAIVQKLDNALSNYKPESEVSRLNTMPSGSEREVSPEVFQLLMEAKRLNVETENAFDVTVGPLVNLWTSAALRGMPPEADEIAEARASVGSRHMILNASRQTVAFERPGMRIDTDGIGKGFAVDRAGQFLKTAGVECALIDFGTSSIFALGVPPNQPFWRLLIQFPDSEPLGYVLLKDTAISASDSFSRAVEINGGKSSRLIDPRQGAPVRARRQCIAVGPSATTAEALSKALIMRPAQALKNREGLTPFEYLLLEANGSKVKSSGFPLESDRVRK